MLRYKNSIMREKLLAYGKTIDGSEMLLGVPGRLSLKKDKDAASLLSFKIRLDNPKERLCEIWLLSGNKEIFRGIPDEEIYTRDQSGTCLEISARCKISLLIDNEVMPQQINNPSVSFFSRKFLEPLGFKLKSLGKKGFGELKAVKGTSVLGFLNSFLGKAFDTKPVIKSDGSIYLLSEYSPRVVKPDEGRLLRAEVITRNYEAISEYVLKDSVTGAYNMHVTNPENVGLTRIKYRDNPKDIDFTVSREVKLILEGFVDMEVYDRIEFLDESGVIESVKYERDASGDRTTVCFKT